MYYEKFSNSLLSEDIRKIFCHLSCSVLAQAAKDMLAPFEINENDNANMRKIKNRNFKNRKKIYKWIDGKDESGNKDLSLFSLENCCAYINDFSESGFPKLTPKILRKIFTTDPKKISDIYHAVSEPHNSTLNITKKQKNDATFYC